MFTEHTYELSENIQIFFTDSGPPPNSNDYTTLVALHGSAFNGFGFERLHGVAFQHNLRTIVWNRRDYPGSTPYTDSELEDLKRAPKTFMNRIGSQIGEFLVKFIEREKIPKATDDGKAGGIAIMGWSMGTATAMSLFSHSDILPSQTYSILDQYVKDLVLNDSPYLSFGLQVPPEVISYDPWTDPDAKTPQEKYQRFLIWASSFYDHPDTESGNLCDMDLISKGTSDNTFTKWSNEEFERYFNKEAAVRSEFPMYVEPMQTTLREITEHVVYDTTLHDSYFPRLKVTLIYCPKTAWHSLWGVQEIRRIYNERVGKGEKARSLRFCCMAGANHFTHWEDPNLLLETTAEAIRR